MELVMAKHPNLFQIGWAGGKVWSYPMIFGMASAMALGCVCFPQPYMHAYSSRSAKGLKAMFLSFGGICLFVITMPTMIGIAGNVIVPGLKGWKRIKFTGWWPVPPCRTGWQPWPWPAGLRLPCPQ